MAKLRKKRGNKCQRAKCNRRTKLQFSHTGFTPILNAKFRSGRKERITDIRANPNKYLLLCQEHNLNMRYRKDRRKTRKKKKKN